jgi:hypothetical protein
MLQTKQDRKGNAAVEKSGLFPRPNDRQYQDAVKEPIVLEMNVVDDQQARREQDRKTCDVGEMPVSSRRGLDISMRDTSQVSF